MPELLMLKDTLPQTREEYFTVLYKKAFPSVARFVSKMGGTLEEAKDIFQEGLIIYYEKSTSGDSVENDQAYILGICRHLWNKKFNRNQKFISISDNGNETFPDIMEETPSESKILRLLERAGKKCMDLLQSFYYEKLSSSELADKFGFSGERSATVQKFKCLEKVRETVKEKSLKYEDFLK